MTTAQDDQVGGTQQTPVVQPVQSTQQQPITPVGGSKEAFAQQTPASEWVSPSTPEVVLPQEVKDAGVEAHPVTETISADAHKSGVRMANNAMVVPTVTQETVSIETQPSVLHHLKKMHKKVSDSLSWLVRLIIKEQDKKAHSTSSGLTD